MKTDEREWITSALTFFLVGVTVGMGIGRLLSILFS